MICEIIKNSKKQNKIIKESYNTLVNNTRINFNQKLISKKNSKCAL